jgi:D-serine deaminase-like pyridoxal phosphate-dependent protein
VSRNTLRPGRAPARAAAAASIDELETPALLVDAAILERNLREMQHLADSAGVRLRPHWKTHKCVELAARQLELGAVGGTVAKTSEAEVFLAAGMRSVMVATPVVDPAKIERLLAARGDAELVVLVESEEGLRRWSAAAARSGRPVPVLLEVDVGMRRTGVPAGEGALPLARAIRAARGVELRGVMTHAGHAYGAASPEEIARIGREEGERLVRTAEAIRADGIPCPVVSVGSTPTVRHSARVPGVTEIRPGNYVFHDRIQVGLGVVPEDRCALTVLATVTARPAPDRVVLDAGAKTLGNDRGASLAGFGHVLGGAETIERLSEEHGILAADPGSSWRVGDRLRVVPNHACIAVHLHERLHVTRGGRVEAVWDVAARGRIA